MITHTDTSDVAARHIGFAEALRVWVRIGCLSFGGPAGQIALMHQELVEKRRWISEPRFLHALNYCMLLPGPEAQQLAVYIGWLLHRTRGGLAAGLLFVLPGAAAMLVLSLLYATLGQVPAVAALLFGLKAAVLAIIVAAVLRLGRRALRSRAMIGIAAAAFVGIYAFALPFPLIVLAAAVTGAVGGRLLPRWFPLPGDHDAAGDAHYVVDAALARGELQHTRPSLRRALQVTLIGLAVWLLPLLCVALWLGRDAVITQQGVLFSQTALVTFGGAYAVLAYVAQRVVDDLHWLTPGQMLDGLGLAETTPGPLILVIQFVAFQAAWQHQGGLSPLLAGVLGSLLTLWVTFVPCFLWIFLGAPYIEALQHNRLLQTALAAVTAAVVGVILNLGLWFAAHTLFASVRTWNWGWLALELPQWTSIDLAATAIAAVALLVLLRLGLGMGWTLLGCALAGGAWGILR